MERLNNLTTKESIASQLRLLIFSGELSDGQEITQNEVADSLSLSRMPVREAFQLLTQEGLLTRLSNRHIAVNGMTFGRAVAFFKHLVASDCIAMDYLSAWEDDCNNEISWHEGLLTSSGDALISSISCASLRGYPEYFLSLCTDEKRMEVLKEIGMLIAEGRMGEAKDVLSHQYLGSIISALEVEFAIQS